MSHPVSFWKRPLTRFCVVAFAGLFIMAPTPGNVGGCSSSAGSVPVAPGNIQASPSETAEYMYFDHGLCSGFCWRLFQCGALCSALNQAYPGDQVQGTPSYAAACAPGNDGREAFELCVRGRAVSSGGTPITPLNTQIFGVGECPHVCPAGVGTYHTAYQWDVQACSDAVQARSCDQAGTGSIGTTFQDAPTECLNICQAR